MYSQMHAYVINLDAAIDRWTYVESNIKRTRIPYTRVSAVNGRKLELPHRDYAALRYRLYHGKKTSTSEIGCYLSHVKCLKMFLDSRHEFGIVCEDDILPRKELKDLLYAAIDYADSWDILRLSGFHYAHPVKYARLPHGCSLTVTLTRLCGTGAYMVNRRAAEVLVRKLLPMRVPFDHALDREWAYGLRSSTVMPLPVDQTEHVHKTQIDLPRYRNYPAIYRYLTVFPYQAFNEFSRAGNRVYQLLRARHSAKRVVPAVAAPRRVAA